jgi:hypothetical protein
VEVVVLEKMANQEVVKATEPALQEVAKSYLFLIGCQI